MTNKVSYCKVCLAFSISCFRSCLVSILIVNKIQFYKSYIYIRPKEKNKDLRTKKLPSDYRVYVLIKAHDIKWFSLLNLWTYTNLHIYELHHHGNLYDMYTGLCSRRHCHDISVHYIILEKDIDGISTIILYIFSVV
jgi:hypothetical protein